jgi:uncharacterized protein (TIGR00255 family)
MSETTKRPKPGERARSMTGYAETIAERDGMVLTVSLRSVNHRFLDLHVHLPDALQSLEPKIRREIQERNPRGRLDLKVTAEGAALTRLNVDEALLGRYIELFRRLGAQYGLPAETDLATLARLPGVLSLAGSEDGGGERIAALEALLLATLRQTLDRWDEMRAGEARYLLDDMEKRVGRVQELAGRLEGFQAEMVRLAQKRFQERIEALLGQAGLDPARLAQEAALLADRADVTEEILRLKTHAARFAAALAQEADLGRKLDFLSQEMHREANTFLAKAAGLGEASLPGTDAALEIKGEIEKLREQVQNLQ